METLIGVATWGFAFGVGFTVGKAVVYWVGAVLRYLFTGENPES